MCASSNSLPIPPGATIRTPLSEQDMAAAATQDNRGTCSTTQRSITLRNTAICKLASFSNWRLIASRSSCEDFQMLPRCMPELAKMPASASDIFQLRRFTASPLFAVFEVTSLLLHSKIAYRMRVADTHAWSSSTSKTSHSTRTLPRYIYYNIASKTCLETFIPQQRQLQE